MFFEDRRAAGRRLAERLQYLEGSDPVVVGLPRGGVPVAYEVARALGAPLDVIVVRKLGLPHQPELAFGALGEGGVELENASVLDRAGLSTREIAQVRERERAELVRRTEALRRGRARVPLARRTVVIVDDGVATGATARAACQVAEAQGARRVVLAAPVASREAAAMLADVAVEVVFLEVPRWFGAVGGWYRHFGQVDDTEVEQLISAAQEGTRVAAVSADDPPLTDSDVGIPVEEGEVQGHLTVPEQAPATVVFAHGSGSSRHSPRNRFVAEVLQRAGLATLLLDLLTPEEEVGRARVFDIDLLSRRLVAATRWLATRPETARLRVAYFGASTGAAAALRAATAPEVSVSAVVSRGGRPDLAGPALSAVRAPTLLIVGGHDEQVLELNREAARAMRCEVTVVVVPGATHLFPEPGALRQVAETARDWLVEQLTGASAPGGGSRADTAGAAE